MQWPQAFKDQKLQQLAEDWGYTVDALLAVYAFDSVAPGICMKEDCDYAREYEPDQREGWCEECQEHSVVSALILAEIV